jgi:hypothetical protein
MTDTNDSSSKTEIDYKYAAIPTEYNGIVYRSRTEARWARFFDLVGIIHKYEHKWFTNGFYQYLPDFYLPEVHLREYGKGVYLEVKATQEEYEETKAKHIVMSNEKFVVCIGNPPPEVDDETKACYQIYPWWDNGMVFARCNACKTIKIEFSETNYYQCPICRSKTTQLHDIWYEKNLPSNNQIFSKKIGDIYV